MKCISWGSGFSEVIISALEGITSKNQIPLILLNYTNDESMNEPWNKHTQHSSSLRVSLIKREKDTFEYSGVVYRRFKNESIDKY